MAGTFNKNIEEVMNDSMMEMSAYALLQRALPDFRDGFKPVARRIITSMNINKTTNFTKSATVEGRVMQLHPHGGSYGSIVGLVQKDRQNVPFLVGKGSWGQYTSSDQDAAAARYTEVKLGKNALEILKELKEKSIKYVPNYDGTIMVPEVLPVTYPNILTQSQDGIAIGFASSTISYNHWELFEAIKEYYSTGTISTLYPDFPTGGILFEDKESAEEIMETGRGSLKIRAKAHIDEHNRIIVTELPYGVKRENVIKKIIDLNKAGKLAEVTDVRDGTSFKGMKIVIKLRKNVDAKFMLEKLYQLTPLQTSISANMNVLFNGSPVVMGVRKMLIEWLKWRESVLIVGLNNKLEIMKNELHISYGLKIVKDDIENVIKIIRFSKDEEVISNLTNEYDIDEVQAEYISKMTIRSLNQERINKRILEIEQKEKDVEELEKNIKDKDFVQNQLLTRMESTLKEIDANERKTEIKEISEKITTIVKKVKNEIKKVSNEEVTLNITKKGYIIKNGDPILGDEIVDTIVVQNDKQIGVLLEDRTIGKIVISEIKDLLFVEQEFGKKSLGYIIEAEDTHVLLGFEDGQLARINSESFITSRKITKNGFYDGAKLVFVEQIDSEQSGTIEIKYGKKKKEIDLSKSNVKSSRMSRGQRFIGKTDEKVSFKLK